MSVPLWIIAGAIAGGFAASLANRSRNLVGSFVFGAIGGAFAGLMLGLVAATFGIDGITIQAIIAVTIIGLLRIVLQRVLTNRRS